MKRLIFLLAGVSMAFASCKKTEKTSLDRGVLTNTEVVGTIYKGEIKDFINEFDASGIAQYDVEVVRVEYVSESKGRNVKTDGILFRPKNADTVYFISYFHGTHIPLNVFGVKKSIPSYYKLEKQDFFENRNIALAWAAAGYTVFMPDYIGYGRTEKEEHPYVYYPELFKSCIDGMKACKSYFNNQHLQYDNRLFLTGWSQGGGASLASHKYLQENYTGEFQVVASSSLAGPYDFRNFLFDVFENKDQKYKMVGIYSWALYTLNKFSGLNKPADQIWKYPVYDQASSFNPPSNIPEKVIKDNFIHRILNGQDSETLAEINKNTFCKDWKPVGKVFLHHGDADDVVPYFNSENAKAGLTAAGGDITLYTYPGGKHETEVKNYVLKTLNDFNALK